MSGLERRPKRRRLDDVAPHSVQTAISEEQSNEALHAIYYAHDIVGFSRAVVEHDRRLQGASDEIHAAFVQKAAAQFRNQFVTRFEDDIRRGKSWGYATACNAVSRTAGGQEGVEACKAMAAGVSQLRDALMREVDPKALSLFAVSFGRHPQSRTCRSGTIRIAEFCRDEGRALGALNSQSLSLLVNGFSKWTERPETREGTEAVANEVCRRAERRFRLSDFKQQELTNLVNGFSKWPEQAAFREAAGAIAGEVLRRDHRARLSDSTPQELANLVNGFSKWPEEEWSRQATGAIAGEVGRRAARGGFGLSAFNHQDLANLVNGFSKWPDGAVYRQATARIATELSRRAGEQGLFHFTPQELANLVNGFGKCPDDADYYQATVAIASEVIRRRTRLSDFNHQDLVNLVNGFSKLPQQTDCRDATRAIAGEVFSRADQFSHLTQQALATLVNGFSKWPEEAASRQVTVAIAGEVSRRAARGEFGLSEFNSQDLVHLVNGFSKWPEEAGSQQATVAIASEVIHRVDRLSGIDPQGLANLVNGFSKWPEAAASRHATGAIASEVVRRRARLGDFTHQQLANLVNGFSKWPDGADCRDATRVIAGEVFGRADQFSHLTQQVLATLVNGFSKWPEEAASRQATVAIAGEVSRRAARGEFGLADFNRQDLVNLVNGFSKWPEEAGNQQATDAIAHEVVRRRARLSDLTRQHLANLVNGFSKWPTGAGCREATVTIAEEIRQRQLSDFAPHELANLVNGFSKWPQAAASRQATGAIASEVLRGARIKDFNHQDLANLVNGFSKWREAPNCRDAAVAIANEICGRQLFDCAPQGLANMVNGFSKWPEVPDCRDATVAIADELLRHGARLSDFTHQHLANLVNGFSKWPEAPDCRDATVAIGREALKRNIRLFTSQGLATLVNGFSKWPDQAESQQGTIAIAHEVSRRASLLSRVDPLELANLVNGFSKWPEAPECREATLAIAGELLRRGARLSDFAHQHLANLVNGFSKWPDAEDCRDATRAIAGVVFRRANLSDFSQQGLANLLNGFSKWPDGEDCRKAAIAIAGEARERQLSDFAPLVVATLMNGFTKWPEEAACRQATMDIARALGTRGQRFSVFTAPHLSILANALSRMIMRAEDSGDIMDTALPKDRLHKLAHYLHYDNDRLGQAGVLHITTIFKALGKARLSDDLGLLAPTGLNRLSELRQAPEFTTHNNLETIGNLCAALLPLARSPQKPLRWHRTQALNLLNDLQPVVEQKIEAHLNASDAERTRGPVASRCPALSIYQTLKARAVLERLFRPPYVEGKRSDLRVRQQELERKTKQILDSTRGLIESDLSSMSWNLIAQIEADSPVDALDLFMEQDAAAIQAQHPASVFDVHQVLRTMDHEPRPPQGEAGLMQLPVVDMHGRQLATEPERRYSIFHRLTSGALPVVAVQLPGTPSAFMLARTVNVNGVPYRMDLFGGSKLKPPRLTVSQIAARAPGEPAKPSGGKLLAIPYADTAPGTAFEQLSRAWAPFKEAYYYTQRRGFAAPPAIKGLGVHDYALEGAFKLSLLPDRPSNQEHPFRLTGPAGPIALRPHDGCGFIRASLAERMPAVRRAGEQEGPDRVPAFAEGRRSSVPASALQHYPRSGPVADEAQEKAMTWLESRQGQELSAEDLFRTVTAGHMDGPLAVAIPSSDECLHVPTLKSETLTGTSGVLIGRSPYDKPNLRPFAAERVKSAVEADPTAVFLDNCTAIQYSFNVAQKSGTQLAADDPTFFAKGILIVVPDKMWPAAYADRGLVMSAEDVKCHSNWTSSKDRVKVNTPLECLGILQATEVFAPGSLVAVPTGEQKKLDGDFDGDTVVILGDRPQLYEHVRQFDQEEQARGLRSLKPPKSHTPAIEDGRYKFGRASQILSATRNVLEIYTGLQRNFLAQSHEGRQWFAERAIFGTYEGLHQELKRDIRGLLEQEQVSAADVQDKLEKARHEIELADHPVAREMAELLLAELEAWAARLDEQLLPEQLLPETIAGVSEAPLAMSQALCELFPELAETYSATAKPRDRVQLLVDRYPARIDPRPDGYNPHDLVQSANNLMSLGIKVGTDAYKSDTGAHSFMFKSRYLGRLLQQIPGLKSVPYTKSIAAILNQGRFDVEATLQDLKNNPTLAASIMQASIKLASQRGILPETSRRGLAADDSAMTITLTREQAAQRAQVEASRAQAEEKDITPTAISVAEALRRADIKVEMPHLAQRLRSESSMTDQLIGMEASFEAGAQLISNAVRHVFQLPDRDFTHAFKKAILAFDESGYAEVSTTNWFRTRSPTFVGIKTVLATPGGYHFEVEFHTADSYKAKIDNHDAYKELQKLQELQRESREPLDKSIAEQLLERVRQACNKVVIPDGAIGIPHWEADADSTVGASLARRLQVAPPRRTEHSPLATEILGALDARSIVLVGMKGAGKSSLGRALAKRLGLRFVDSDREIEAKTGKSKAKIVAEDGEAHFSNLEVNEIRQSLEQGPAVLATGGEAFMSEEVRHHVGEKAVSIWLNTSGDVIRRNLRHKGPKMQTADQDQTITDLMHASNPIYKLADLTIAPQHQRDLKSANACLTALHAHLCGEGRQAQTRFDPGRAAP
ncbi:XopAD/skwp family type III secretion system effector [Mesorhizobium sp. WSM2239]|uniref:Shikimate kinase n=2 Tax=unclassified Mesorhizobium TaxID=325217 RepID=A0AAU8D6J1_9HYPH